MNHFEAAGFGEVPEQFKNLPTIRASALVELCKSPAHYESSILLGEKETTEEMKLGTAIHMAILEPEKFEKTYCGPLPEVPADVVRTQEDLRELLQRHGLKLTGSKNEQYHRLRDNGVQFDYFPELMERHQQGREIVTEANWRAINRIRGRIQTHNQLKNLFVGGGAEQKIWALHQKGVVITGTLDHYKELKKPIMGFDVVATDLKKFPSVEKRDFDRYIYQRKIYIQASIYSDILSYLVQKKLMFLVCGCVSKAPYIVKANYVNFGALDAGHVEYTKALDTFLECLEKNYWPTGHEEIGEATLPNYAWDELEHLAEEELENEYV